MIKPLCFNFPKASAMSTATKTIPLPCLQHITVKVCIPMQLDNKIRKLQHDTYILFNAVSSLTLIENLIAADSMP